MINLTAKLDNDEFQRRLREMRDSARGVTNSIVKDAQRIDTAWQGVASSLKGSEGFGAKLLQGLKPIVPQVEAIRNGVEGIRVDFERFPTIPSLQSLPETTASAARGFNAINFATQQLVREVPAATMGLHMFFLAISNNLPFFADAIKQVREENKALAASGKPTVGVFKQIIGSLFSWQTALIAGITALTLYGKEIGNWVKGLFKGKEALDAVAKAEKTLADVRRQGMLDAQEEVTQVKLAVKAMQDSNRSLDERKRAMRTLQDQYPEYFGKLREEQMLYGEVGDSVDVLIQKMVALATARKSFDKLVENEQNLQLLQGMDSYSNYINELNKYKESGSKKYYRNKAVYNEFGVQVGWIKIQSDEKGVKTDAYKRLLSAQDALLENLEEGGKEAEALFKEISDKYDGDVNAYIKAIEESNKKLTDEASALITTPDLSEDKAAAEERKRKAEAALAEAERQAEERKRAIQRLNNNLSKEVQRTQREMDDAEIASIKDGIERKRREIQAGYERRAAEIDKYEADIKAAQGGELTPEQKGHISYLRQANTDTLMAGKVLIKAMQDEAAQEATDAMNEYLASYGTFQEKLLAITAKYSRLISEAKTEGERMTLEAERDAILAEYEVQASDWAKSLVDKSTEQLQTMASNLQSVVDSLEVEYNALDSSDTDEAKQLRETINMLKAQIKELQEQLNKANKAVKDDNWADATQVFQNISKAAQDAAEGIEEFDEGAASVLRTMAQLAGTAINLIGAIQAVAKAATAAAGTISAMEKASVILAVIGAAIQAVSALFSLFKGSDEVEQTMRQFEELNKELERFRKLAQIDSVEGTIFGDNAFGNFANNLRVMQEAYKELEATRQTIETNNYDNQLSYFERLLERYEREGNLKSAAYIQKKIDELKASGLANQGLTNALSGMTVQLGKNRSSTLGEQLPELFAGGEVTLDALKMLQESDVWDKLSQENRDLIDEMIADWERYEDATEASNRYLSDIFGELGGSITNALVDAFENGTDAAEAMRNAFSDVVEQMARDMALAAFIQPLLEETQKGIEDLNNRRDKLTDEEYINELISLGANLVDGALAQEEGVNNFLRAVDERMAALGYESAFDGDGESQSATSRGFQAMSQETGSELNGRFTAIQGAVEFIKGISTEQLKQTTSINDTLAHIHNDTSLIEKHTRVLGQMGEDIASIKRTLDDGI